MATTLHARNTTASLSESVSQALEKYFDELNHSQPLDLYKLVLEEVEAPMFKTVMDHARYNQSRAAKILGISRGTLRAKLRRYFDDKYVGTREE